MPRAKLHLSEANESSPTQGALKQIATLSHLERRVIHLLRAHVFPEKDARAHRMSSIPVAPALVDAFSALAAEVLANRLAVFAPNSAFVSGDEMTILNRLMLLQRPSRSGNWQVTSAFQIALKRCATELESEGRRLPARPLRDTSASDQDCFEIRLANSPRPGVPRERHIRLWDGQTEPEPGTLRAKALEIVRKNELAATSQFLSAGINHQYLFWLNRHGYVEKVAHGFYCFPVRCRGNSMEL